MRDLSALSVRDFEAHVGRVFSLVGNDSDGPLAMELVEATATGRPAESGKQPFALLFQGPPNPVLGQAIYRLECDGFGTIELFLVPLGPGEGCVRYEAVFS